MLPVWAWPEVVKGMLEVPGLMKVVVPRLKLVELEVVDVGDVEGLVVGALARW